MKQDIPKKLNDFLRKTGLAEKEIAAYAYLLANGPQSASRLAKACGLVRTNAYDIIKGLEAKGLCTNLGSQYGRLAKASPPAEIADILESKEREIGALKDELDDVLPLFAKLGKGAASLAPTQAIYFNGREGLRKLLRLSLHAETPLIRTAGSEIDMIGSLGAEFMAEYHERRASKGIALHALRPGKERGIGAAFSNDARYLRQIRVRPEGLVRLKSSMLIWDSNVALFSGREELFASLVMDGALAVMLQSWFDFIWEKSRAVR